MSIAKPQMRGLLSKRGKTGIPIILGLSCLCGYAYYHFISKPRIALYEHHFSTWNDEIAFERMRRTGMFQAAPLNEDDDE